MTATETLPRTHFMPADAEAGTKTVRIAAESAKRLQTISALMDQMGRKFKPVEFLNGLVEGPIDSLYEKTVKEFEDYRKANSRKK